VTFDLRDTYRQLVGPGQGPWWMGPIRAVVRWTVVFYKQLERDKAFVRAAGMAYATLVALVPMLMLAFGVLGAVGVLATSEGEIEDLLFGTFLGDLPEVREFLVPGLMAVDLRTLGAVGVIGLLVVASRLYAMVEKAYNDVFDVPITRPFLYRVLNFYFTVTAVPLLVAAGIAGTQEALGRVEATSWFAWSGPVSLFAVFLTAIKLFPCTYVRWGPALSGALVTTALVHGAGKLFPWYVRFFASDDPLRVIYGSVGVIPVFLLWLYCFWIFVLLGVEVAYVAQNFRSLVSAEREQIDLDRTAIRALDVGVAVEVAVRVADAFERGDGAISASAVARDASVHPRDAREVLGVLERAGLMLPVGEGFVLARPPEAVEVGEVARAWRRATSVRKDAIDPVADAVDAALIERLGVTLHDAAVRLGPPRTTVVPAGPRLVVGDP
jgi:YihY family inner membrane protein